MKKYSDFITEVLSINHIQKDDKLGYGNLIGNVKSDENMANGLYKKLSKMKGGHEVWMKKSKDFSEYLVRNPKTGIVHLAVNGYNKVPGVMKIGSLASDSQGPKAADVYQHLLKKGHLTALETDGQSPGGKKVWMNLSKKQNINIHGWDTENNKPVNLGKRFDDMETHVSDNDIGNITIDALLSAKNQNKKETDAYVADLNNIHNIRQMHLIAHYRNPKKKLKEDAPANSAGAGAVAGLGVGPQGEPGVKKRGKFGKYETFLVSPDTFLKARLEKQKGKHWRTYLEEDEAFSEVREYANKHKGPVILQCERTGAMCFARYT
jgi:hypothetical protein